MNNILLAGTIEVMTNSNILLWGGIAIAVLLLILIAIVVIGKKRGDNKKVHFEKPLEEPKQLTQEQKSGNYRAKSGFNFAPANADKPKEQAPIRRKSDAGNAGSTAVAAGAGAAAGASAANIRQPEQDLPESEEKDATRLANEQLAGKAPTQSAPGPAPDVEAVKQEESPEQNSLKSEAAREAEQEQEQKAAEAEEARKLEAEQAERAKELRASEEKAVTGESSSTEGTHGAAGAAAAGGVGAAGVAGAAASSEEASPVFDEVVEEHDAAHVEDSVDAQDVEKVEAAEQAQEAAAAAEVQQDAVERALEETPVPESEPAPAQEPTDDIEPAAGRLGRLRGRLSRSQNAIGQGLMGILSAGDLDEDAWEEIEDTLIMADLGTKVTMKVTESLRDKIAERGVSSEQEARAMLRETLIEVGHPEMDRSIKAMPNEGKPAVIMVVGVNGTGKTTTTGKLARVLVSMGHKVLLGAADTFRAAAADQLETWGRRVGATTVRGKEGADPASVAFDAVAAGVEQQVDVVLVDTAGRLHTSTDLMDQLGKVKRVVEKKAIVDEVLLVVDATVGQNGLQQARIFREVVDITGVVLTKLDGTAKGGIVFQVQEELGVPVKLVGLGEGADHLAPFEVESFVDALLGER
ncbi:signal recognition particle-docking protein FtsY [Corynebacterium endometrii]|uniref:Signal recognition particle receptor FtsY n=1 Tax=Corynebacterium endometrii TaxID=2488819 RepID=A0A4P7QG47_9CORY|nr:signal recognition particle-docking protein FtsY [Corynebacterium endometrii]QCB28731.1 Signal recognition particle receptor FtsY [Corynebacterium endometrii]